ncbi:MAG: MMPL family transporter, partial [Pirellulaceae bacterium]|nr:MMPL family transporter [Pirellulaceae bacterium]
NFGFYSAAAVLATLVLLFLVLPAWLSLWPSREFAEKVKLARDDPNERTTKKHTLFHRVWHVIGGQVIRHNGLVAAGCVGVMIFFAVGVRWIDPSIQLMKLFSPGTRILVDYEWLEHHLGPLMPMEVVVRVDKDSNMTFAQQMRLARDVESAIETLEPVGGAISAATFAPDLGKRRFRVGGLSGQKERFLSKELEEHREDFAEGGYLQVDKETGEELWRVSARVEALSDLDYGAFVEELRAVVEPIREYYVANGATGISVTYTGLVPLVYKAQTELFTGLFNSLLMAFVLIAFVMMLVLRSFSAGMISMLPNLFPVLIIFGAMGWLGILVDVGTMMTASVALGVAVDDTIHYLTWFRHGLDMGYSRKRAAMVAYQRCATAMSQTTLIGGLGLAVFALSTFTPTQRFGYIMLTLLFAALVGDLIFLPALLTGPFGRFFDRGRKPGGGDDGRPRDDWSSPETRPARRRVDEQATVSDLPSKSNGEPISPRRDKPSPLPTPHGHLAKPRRLVKE